MQGTQCEESEWWEEVSGSMAGGSGSSEDVVERLVKVGKRESRECVCVRACVRVRARN